MSISHLSQSESYIICDFFGDACSPCPQRVTSEGLWGKWKPSSWWSLASWTLVKMTTEDENCHDRGASTTGHLLRIWISPKMQIMVTIVNGKTAVHMDMCFIVLGLISLVGEWDLVSSSSLSSIIHHPSSIIHDPSCSIFHPFSPPESLYAL